MCCVLTVLIIIYIDDTQRDGPIQKYQFDTLHLATAKEFIDFELTQFKSQHQNMVLWAYCTAFRISGFTSLNVFSTNQVTSSPTHPIIPPCKS